MDLQNTQVTEPTAPAADTDKAELAKDQLTPEKSAEKTDQVKSESFFPQKKIIDPAKPDDRADGIISDVFHKFVTTNEDGTANLDGIPNEFAWTKDKIKDKYSGPQDTQKQDIASIVQAELAKERDKASQSSYEEKVNGILADDKLTNAQKQEIAEKADELRSAGLSSSKALDVAKSLATVQEKKTFGTTAPIGRVPDVNKLQYTKSELADMPIAQYKDVKAKIESGKVRVVAG